MKRFYSRNLKTILFVLLLNATGISFAQDYYWVGGSGSWTDLSHWATTSGGTTPHIIVPSPLSNVIFDANSFTANGQTVVTSFEAFCNTLVASNLGYQVVFDFNAGFNAESGIDVEGDITWQQSGSLSIDAGGLVLGNGLDFTLNSGVSNIDGGFLMETSSTAVHSGNLFIHSGGLTLESGATLTATGTNNTTGNNVTGDILINDGGMFTQNGYLMVDGDFNMIGNSDYIQNYGEYRISNGDINLGNGSNFWSKGGYWGYIFHGNLNMVSGSVFRDDAYFQFYVGDLVIPSGAIFYQGGGDKYLRSGGFKAEAGSTVTSTSGRFFIYDGGFELDPAANVLSYGSQLYFRSTAFGQYNIQSSGINLRRIQFDGTNHNAEWTLVDDLTATSDGLFMYANKFISNGKAIDVSRFYSWTSGVVQIDLTGTPVVNVATEFRLFPSTNTTLTWDSPNRNITWNTGSNISFYAGVNNTFDNLIMNATSTGGTQIHMQYATTIGSVTINASGEQYLNWYDAMTVDDFTLNYSKDTANRPNVYMSGGKNVINAFTINSSGTLKVALRTHGNNTFNVFDVGNRMDSWEIQSLTTQTASDIKPILGTCEEPILITSNNLGSQGTISQLNGAVTGDYLQLQDNKATGGATFTTTNTADLGNVTGWTIVPIAPETFYWIGENGVWSDPDNWSLTSGGPAYCAVPSRIDDVVFDANSFSASGQFCRVDLPAECNDMIWNGIDAGAGFSGNQQLDIYGSLKLDSNMNNAYNGIMDFEAIDNNNTIETQGVTLYQVRIMGQAQNTGVWTLVDNLTTSDWLYVNRGTFNSDGNNLDVRYFSSSNSTVNFTNGTTLIKIQERMEPHGSTTLDMGIADILFEATNRHMYFRYANGHNFNKITYNQNGTAGYQIWFRDNNNSTFKDIVANQAGNTYIYFYNNRTNTFADITLNQNRNQYIFWNYMFSNTFKDVVLNHNQGGHTQYYVSQNNTYDSYKVLHNYTSGSPQFMHYSNSTGNNFGDFEFSTIDPNVQPYFWSDAAFTASSFVLTNVDRAQFRANATYNFDDISITADCSDRTLVSSRSSGTATNFVTTTTADADFVVMTDINASGTGVYSSSNSIDGGNVTGWPMGTGTNLYWVGGAGSWNDLNHWSFTSGGPTAGCMPTRGDNVFFDVNSFTGPNQNVNVNVAAEFKNMVWNNVNSPNITGNQTLNVYGSLQLAPNLTWNHTGWTYFQAREPGKTITTNGVQMYQVQFLSDGTYDGEWTLQDDLDVRLEIYMQRGSFISNGNNISSRSFINNIGNSQNSIDFTGTSLISVKHRFEIWPNTTFNIGSADIKWSNMESGYYRILGYGNTFNDLIFDHDDGANRIYLFNNSHNNVVNNVIIETTAYPRIDFYNNQTYNDISLSFDNNTTNIPTVYFNGSNTMNIFSSTSIGNAGPYLNFQNNNTFNDLIAAGLGTRLLLGANRTQTVNGLLALGNGSFPVFVKSLTDGQQATLFTPDGQICLEFVLLQDIKASANTGTGTNGLAAEFFAGSSSVDLGNNTNWQFTNCVAYYWVGDSGNWSDYANHWATSSGGTFFHVDAPGPDDDVYFDANSFTTNGRVVNVDVANATAQNMTWQSALFTPTFTGNTTISIHGDLKLITLMNQDFTGNWNFEADDAGNILNTSIHSIREANFNGEGEWVVQNSLLVDEDINFNNGTLNTNNKDISAQNFNSITSNTRSLVLGDSEVTIINGNWNPATLSDTALDEGTSTIFITGDGGMSAFLGNSLEYNDVTFTTTSNLDASLTGTNTFNTLQFDKGLTLTLEPTTQTMTQLIANGSCDDIITIKSADPDTPIPATFSQATGATDTSFLDLSNNIGTGGATFNADFSIDSGSNSGWNFTEISNLDIDITQGDVDCELNNDGFAEVTAVTGGTPPYTYLWSTTETTSRIENLIPGEYSVTVTDASNCAVAVAVAVINEPSSITPVPITTTDVDICIGTSIDFQAGSPAGVVSYLWDFGDFTDSTEQNPSHTYAAGGTYTVSLSYIDDLGCPAIVTETIRVSDLQTNLDVANVDCFGNDNGSIEIEASGGVEPYQYSIDNGTTYVTTSSFTNLVPGTYNVIVVDAIQCTTAAQTINISQPSSNAEFTFSTVGVSCAENADGTITFSATGGTPPYDYSINNGIAYQSSNTFVDLPFGSYNVVVRDDNNCIVEAQLASIGLEDIELPTITCPTNVEVVAIVGDCDAEVTVTSPSVNDNCVVESVVNDFNGTGDASGTYPLGTTTVVWTVKDVNGNINTCSMTVTVNDSQDPTAVCKNIEITLDANGQASIVAADVDNGSSDPCGSITLSVSQVDFDCDDIGENLVTLTVTDANDNVATCDATVTVLAPEIEITGNAITINDGDISPSVADDTDFGQPIPGAPVAHTFTIENNGTADLAISSLSMGGPDASNFVISGINTPLTVGVSNSQTFTVTFTATPIANYSATVNINGNDCDEVLYDFAVQAEVTCLPVAIKECQNNIEVNNTPGQCGAAVTYTSTFIGDPAPTVSYSYTGATVGSGSGTGSGSTFNVGVTNVTINAINPCGNENCSFTVTVLDNEDPTVSAATDVTANTSDDGVGNCTAAVAISDATFGDNCSSNLTWAMTGVTTGTGSGQVGTQTFNLGVTTITYTNTDGSTNTAMDAMTVTVSDDEDPTVSAATDVTANTSDDGVGNCTVAVAISDATFGDNCSSNLTWAMTGVTTGTGSGQVGTHTFNLGVTTITYTNTDGSTNTAMDAMTVTVVDNEAPTVSAATDVTANTSDDGVGNCTVAVAISDATFGDNCSSNLTWAMTGVTTGTGSGQVGTHTFNLGVTTITYTNTDGSSNTAMDAMTVTVVDNEAPTVSAATDVTANTSDDGVGNCTVAVAISDATFGDNCSSNLTWAMTGVTTGTGSGQVGTHTFNLGETTITYTNTDGSSNTAMDAMTVTVSDDEDPTVSAATDVTANTSDDGVGNCTVAVAISDATFGDNCSSNLTWAMTGVTTGTGSGQVGTHTFNLGVTTITYTNTDGSSNTAMDAMTVTVSDDEDPTVSAATDVTANTSDDGVGNCTVAVAISDATFGDNCSSNLTWAMTGVTTGTGSGQVGTHTFNLGETTITYTNTDGSSNTAMDAMTVTVSDDEDPTVSAATDVTANTSDDGVGNCTVAVAISDATFGDNCSSNLTWAMTGVTTGTGSGQVGTHTFNLGVTTITYTNTDGSSNTAMDAMTVTVSDDEDPTVSAATDVTANTSDDGVGNCTVAVAISDATFGDNCSSNLTWAMTGVTTGTGSGQVGTHTFNLGVTTITYTNTDGSSNTAMDAMTVTVSDDEDPTVSAATDVTANTSDDGVGNCTVAVAISDATFGDNCSSNLTWAMTGVTSGTGSGQVGTHTFNLGVTTITYTNTDGSSNTAMDAMTVTVSDKEIPTVSAATDVTANTSDDGVGNCTVAVAISDATFGDNCSSNLTWAMTGVTTGTGSGQVGTHTFNLGVTTITYTNTDGSSNTAMDAMTVTVSDKEIPTVSAATDVTANTSDDGVGNCTVAVAISDATFGDNCSSNLTWAMTGVTTGTGSGQVGTHTFNLGVTTITYTNTDGSSNTAMDAMTVTVSDDEDPTVSAATDVTANTSDDGVDNCTVAVAISDATFGDNCSSNLTWAMTGVTTGTGSGQVGTHTFNLGVTTITYTNTDGSSNTAMDAMTVTVSDKEIPTITCVTDVTQDTDEGLCTAVVNDIAPTGFDDNCTVASVSYEITGATTGSGDDDASGTVFNFGISTVTYTVTDQASNSNTCSFVVDINNVNTTTSVTVTPDTEQYSDMVIFEATVIPGECTGAGQAATHVTFSVGTQEMGTVLLKLIDGNLIGTLSAALLETPSYPSNGQMAPGSHVVKASFTGVDPDFTVENATTSITITQEDAIVQYTGQALQATPNANSDTAIVVLSANIQDITVNTSNALYDEYAGDIRNAKVMFVERLTTGDVPISGWIPVTDLIDPVDNRTGTVSYNWTVDIGNQDSESFTIGIIVDNGYYLRNSGEDDTVVTVYVPRGDFITGGGYITPDASEGTYASTDGLKTNFGFNVKYNKRGTRLKGHMNIIFRRLESDGVHIYHIKSNAIQSLGVDASDPDVQYAQFIAKANLKDNTDPLFPESLGGNLTLKVDITDRGEPGVDDSIGINLTNSSGTLLYSSNWTGISTSELTLTHGNIVVHSGFSVNARGTDPDDDPAADPVVDINLNEAFEIETWPNPSDSYFNLSVKTPNSSDTVNILVTDVTGKRVHFDSFGHDSAYRFGEHLQAGVYYVRISQGNDAKTIRVIKH